MGVQKKTRKFARVRRSRMLSSNVEYLAKFCVRKVKRIIGQQDARLKKNQDKAVLESRRKAKGDDVVREVYAPHFSFHS